MRRYFKSWPHIFRSKLIFFLFALPAHAQGILEVAPDQISTLVDGTINGKPLVVHYTSDDGSCSHCVENNAFVEAVAPRLSDNFDFVSITLNPWRQFFETAAGEALTDFQAARGFPLSGVPAVMIFANGEAVQLLPGANPSLEDTLTASFGAISNQELVVRGDVSVANIPPGQLETYINAFSADRPVLLTLSSTDEACPHCITGNGKVDDVSRYLFEDYVFVRTDYNPWQSVTHDAQTTAYLEPLGIVVDGLPTSLLFFRGKLLGTVVTNGQDLRTVLSQALPAIKEMDQ